MGHQKSNKRAVTIPAAPRSIRATPPTTGTAAARKKVPVKSRPSHSQMRIAINQLAQSLESLEDRIAAVDEAKEEVESAKWALKLLSDLTEKG